MWSSREQDAWDAVEVPIVSQEDLPAFQADQAPASVNITLIGLLRR
jgi:hypothetical protein